MFVKKQNPGDSTTFGGDICKQAAWLSSRWHKRRSTRRRNSRDLPRAYEQRNCWRCQVTHVLDVTQGQCAVSRHPERSKSLQLLVRQNDKFTWWISPIRIHLKSCQTACRGDIARLTLIRFQSLNFARVFCQRFKRDYLDWETSSQIWFDRRQNLSKSKAILAYGNFLSSSECQASTLNRSNFGTEA